MPYIGKSPEMGVRTRYYYTVSAGATSVSGSDDNSKSLIFSDGEFVDVSLNGVALVAGTDYNTTTANTIAGLSAMSANDVVEVIVYDVFSVFSGDISGDLAVGANLSVTGDYSSTTSGTSNLRLGVNAGNSIASGGNYNVVIGDEAGTALTTGDNNVAIGYKALKTEDAHGTNVAVGAEALETLNVGGEGYNVAVGYKASEAETTGKENTMVGAFAGGFGTTASRAVGLGYSALYRQNPDSLTNTYNTALGYHAGYNVTTGTTNTIIGGLAGDALNTGGANTILGYSAAGAMDAGEGNVAIGYQALDAETGGISSVAIGANALGGQNFSSGVRSGNIGIGLDAGKVIAAGDFNTIIGTFAGDALSSGNKNTVLGYNALTGGTTYDGNVAIGYEALKVADNTTGADGNNVAVGASSAVAVTTGLRNTILGVSAGSTLTTGNDNICVGKGADVSANGAANQITIGQDINAGGDNNFSFGKASNVVTNDFDSDANWSRSSDRRKKKEIYDQELGLDFVNDLRTVNFKWKPSNEFPKEWNDYSEKNNMDTDVVMHGFIAQEVKEALDKHSSERDSKFSGWKEGEDGMQHTSREMFVIPLIKAVQELSAQVDTLKAEIKELKDG